jgi:two-component system response regulator AtoC
VSDALSILIVDDDPTNLEYLSALVEALGYSAETASSGQAALARLAQPPRPDLVVVDVVMPELDGVETLRRYRAGGGKAPVVMCSALDESETVVKAMRAGATDYITKPFNPDELREILGRAAGQSGKAQVATPRSDEPTGLGATPSMRAIQELIERIADADVPVLITGESGVGKDVVAREIHARSARASRVFVKINCAALPGELLESELFGHERGSFTGAQKTKPGQFELADGGTLFLDEIGEMPVAMQAKLLQALQDGEFYRVGGQKKIRVDTRVIVATNVDLARAIAGGTFREDLYYRLNVVQVAIPPLRERREDIPRLFEHFLDKYSKRYQRPIEDVPPEVMQRLLAYDYPGNIRELENLVRRLIVLRDSRYILGELQHPAATVTGTPERRPPMPTPVPAPATEQNVLAFPASAPMTYGYPPPAVVQPGMMTVTVYTIDLKELGRRASNAAEREAIVIMLRHTGGNKREAAERLGISYKAILYKIREFGIGRPRNRRPAPPPAPTAEATAEATAEQTAEPTIASG